MSSGTVGRRRVIIKIWLEGFFIAVERRARPELGGRPIVVGGMPTTRGRVAACSREAASAGVRIGQALADAHERCPDAVFVAGEIGRYVDAWRLVDRAAASTLGRATWASLHEGAVCLDEVSLAQASSLAEAFFRDVRERHGLGVSCGVATGRPAAAAAARLAAPSGVLSVFPGYEARFLAPLALDCLEGLAGAASSRLRALGVETIGQVAAASAEVLTTIFGPSAHVVRALARGEDLFTPRRPTAAPVGRMAPIPSARPSARAMS